jgi:Na+-translocating ferredoxin:NAD+ oxidoreductase RnfD subunit
VLGWPPDHFIHSVNTGSLLLFSFFMISDPKTSPDHPLARIIWAVVIAAVAFYLTAFKWKYNTAIWVLVAAAPLVPLLNAIFKSNSFQWKATTIQFPFISTLKK